MDKSLFHSSCIDCFARNDLDRFISDDIILKLYELTVRMLEVNSYMNLTRITEMNDVILKHYADSLTVSRYIPKGSNIIDVGCGAGFPSLVLAIARPDLHVTALDSTAKRIGYINETASLLELHNIAGIAARAEEMANDACYREKFDVACARAVAKLNILSELCLPFVKTHGIFTAMKANYDDELSEALTAINKLGGKVEAVDSFQLTSVNSSEINPRCIICVRKNAPTPNNYPRNYAQINKKPL